MPVQRAIAALVSGLVVLTSGCASLLGADATPVPGAAATLTRSERTPIPTPPRTAIASPSAAVASRAAPSPSAASSAPGQVISDDEVAQVRQRMEQLTAGPDLPGLETLLLDHVSLSTAQGGSVLDAGQTAAWLRDHAAAGIKVTQVERGTQTVLLQVQTDGWPKADPIQQGQVIFSLRRYDPNNRPDEDQGDWKIDVIDAE